MRRNSGDTGYEYAGLFNYGSPHLRKTYIPGGFTILMEHIDLAGRILKFKIKLERWWTSSSRDALARKDAVVTGVTKMETTVSLGVSVSDNGV